MQLTIYDIQKVALITDKRIAKMSPADPRQFDRVCFVFVRLCPPGELFVSVAFVSIDQSELTFGMQ